MVCLQCAAIEPESRKQKQPRGKAKRRREGRKTPRLQKEIQRRLNEQGGNRPQKRPKRGEPRGVVERATKGYRRQCRRVAVESRLGGNSRSSKHQRSKGANSRAYKCPQSSPRRREQKTYNKHKARSPMFAKHYLCHAAQNPAGTLQNIRGRCGSIRSVYSEDVFSL